MPGRSRPSGTRSLAATQVIATALVATSAWLLYAAGEAGGLLGVVIGLAVFRAADDRRCDRVLQADAAGLRAGDAACTAVVLAPSAEDPVADARAVLACGAGVVPTATGHRVVLASDLRGLSVEHCLRGDWVRVARPAREVAATDALADLDRLPRGRQAWVVLVGDLPLGVLRRTDVTTAVTRHRGAGTRGAPGTDPVAPSVGPLPTSDPPTRRPPWS